MKKYFSKKIVDDFEYYDYMFIIGLILFFTGLTLYLLFNNKTQSITFLIIGVIISLIAKYKNRNKN